ncbi:TniQ family protein [Streptomyces daliensis]|uniref:TniQ family protein n=1 Tax=Streptomyces daliensis TaxID=299421 RepID=A0A8T4INL2_9ACTN|nr:TniQ family protein [Streptomyces daliensis]
MPSSPLPGEALDSWLAAPAHRSAVDLRGILTAAGASLSSSSGLAPDYTTYLTDEEAERLSWATGVPARRLHAMTLRQYDGRALALMAQRRLVQRFHRLDTSVRMLNTPRPRPSTTARRTSVVPLGREPASGRTRAIAHRRKPAARRTAALLCHGGACADCESCGRDQCDGRRACYCLLHQHGSPLLTRAGPVGPIPCADVLTSGFSPSFRLFRATAVVRPSPLTVPRTVTVPLACAVPLRGGASPVPAHGGRLIPVLPDRRAPVAATPRWPGRRSRLRVRNHPARTIVLSRGY